MLVVFKSAPILKRVLKVKHDLLQLYVLKVRIFYVTDLLKASNSCCFRANLHGTRKLTMGLRHRKRVAGL